jgi:hypothetical protein
MECEGWTNQEAIAEMRAMGYTTIDSDVDINQYLNTFSPGVLARKAGE